MGAGTGNGTATQGAQGTPLSDVLVGTPIREDHANYMLMYDMLTGIRISVSRCNSRPPRDPDLADFSARHKLAFDITGTELTPRSKYDFKFKDYAPWVFRRLRDLFKVDGHDYLLSLTGKYVLSELGSPGKSGSFFYYSADYRFIIKTIHASEHRVLLKILSAYYAHILANPNTLLCRILGLHRVKLPKGSKIHFVVMGNIFPPNKDIHEVYDLKGSTVGRLYDDSAPPKGKGRPVLKDLNWLQRSRKLELGPEATRVFLDQLQKDVEWLSRCGIMDYSLLIGLHDLSKGNRENIRDNTLAVFEPNTEPLQRQLTKRGSKASAIRRMIAESDPVQLGPSSTKLPENAPVERKYCIFYQDEGGIYSRDDSNKLTGWLYFLGVIDIFTYYDFGKRLETFGRSFIEDRKKISAVNPIFYGKRFTQFMTAACVDYSSIPTIIRDADASSLRSDAGTQYQSQNQQPIIEKKEPSALKTRVGALVDAESTDGKVGQPTEGKRRLTGAKADVFTDIQTIRSGEGFNKGQGGRPVLDESLDVSGNTNGLLSHETTVVLANPLRDIAVAGFESEVREKGRAVESLELDMIQLANGVAGE